MTRSFESRAWLAALLLAWTLPAAALKSDREKPMDIDADRFESAAGGAEATLSGNVRIVQGTLEVQSDTAVVTQGAGNRVERAVLTGAPARLAQDLDEGGRLDARAARIDYRLADETVVFTGDVVIRQPRGELRGERVTYELATGKITGSGEGEAARVRLRLEPQTASGG